jgi:hypothetical protein
VPTPQGSEPRTSAASRRRRDRRPGPRRARIIVDGQLWRFPIADVDVAKIVPDWDAVMKGGRGQVRAADAPAGKPGKPSKPGAGKPAGKSSRH